MSEPAPALTDATVPVRPRAPARQLWVDRLARFTSSGLTPAQFCATEGVSLAAFYSWRRRLAKTAEAPPNGQAPDAGRGPRLVPVRLTAPVTPVELVLPCGAVVRLLPGCDLAFVRSLLEALGGMPC